MFCLFCCSFSEGWKCFFTPHLHMKHKHDKIQPPGPQCRVMADWEAVSQWPLTSGTGAGQASWWWHGAVRECHTNISASTSPVFCIRVSPMWIFVHVLVTLKYKAKSKWWKEKGRTNRASKSRSLMMLRILVLNWMLSMYYWTSKLIDWLRLQALSHLREISVDENESLDLPSPVNGLFYCSNPALRLRW